jgi:hypothetical protein
MKKFTLLFVVIAAWAQSAAIHAAEQSDAQKAFEQGTMLFNESKYNEAATLFQKSYDLSPSWKILLNIGRSHAAAKNFGPALEAFEAYLAQGGDNVPAEEFEKIVAAIRSMRGLVGQLQAEAPDGAELVIDGLHRGRFPLPGPILVTAGVNHDVRVISDKETLVQKNIRIESGRTIELSVSKNKSSHSDNPDTEKEARANPPAESTVGIPKTPTTTKPEDTQKYYSKPLRIAGWVTGGTGIGLLVAGIITGTLAWSRYGNNQSDDCENGCEEIPPEIKNLQVTTNVLLGEGGVLTLIGASILTYSFVKQRRDAKRVAVFPDIQQERLELKLVYEF